MKSKRLLSMLLLLSVITSTIAVFPTFADDDNKAVELQRIQEALDKAKQLKGDCSDDIVKNLTAEEVYASQNTEKVKQAEKENLEAIEKMNLSAFSSQSSSRKELRVKNYGQQYNYYCAPAAIQIVLSAKMSWNKLPGQQRIASGIGTTKNGTDFSPRLVKALQDRIGGPGAGYELMWCQGITRDRLMSCVKTDIDQGYAFLANGCSVGDTDHDSYVPGYPLYDVWHYVAVTGYDNGKVIINDPAYRLPGFNIKPQYDFSIREFRGFVEPRGIVW